MNRDFPAFLFFSGLVCLFSACQSARISRYHSSNVYLPLYDNVVYNDSLGLFVPSFGDVTFEQRAKKLRRRIRHLPLAPGDSVVLWGDAEATPFYSFALLVSDVCTGDSATNRDVIFQRDTCVNGRQFRLIGFSAAEQEHCVTKDLTSIWSRIRFDSLATGPFGSVFSITGLRTNKLYEVLDNVQQFPVWTAQDKWSKTQLVLTYASFLGNNEQYRRALDALEYKMVIDTAARYALDNTPAIHSDAVLAAIVADARDSQLVMINENHFYPNHRLLVYDLLDSLKSIGFQYLALEALAPEQEHVVNRHKEINLQTGFYTQEQQYAKLLRKALDLEFTLVAYENTDPAKDREAGQADNLFNKTFANDPTAKVLVFAGMDHILETPANGKKWMAALFKERYGIDPLTISQNDFKHLRNLAPEGYLLMKGDAFNSDRLRAVDYHVINGKRIPTVDQSETLVYKNPSKDSVQVLLFVTDKPANTAMATEVPYFTTLVPGKSKIHIPIVPGKPALVVAYDRQGNRVK